MRITVFLLCILMPGILAPGFNDTCSAQEPTTGSDLPMISSTQEPDWYIECPEVDIICSSGNAGRCWTLITNMVPLSPKLGYEIVEYNGEGIWADPKMGFKIETGQYAGCLYTGQQSDKCTTLMIFNFFFEYIVQFFFL